MDETGLVALSRERELLKNIIRDISARFTKVKLAHRKKSQ
jgi:hypothetical protein